MKTKPTASRRCCKKDLIKRACRRLGRPKITQEQMARAMAAFLAEIEATLAAGVSIVFKDHFSFEVEVAPAQSKFNPRHPEQKVAVPELSKVRLRLSQQWRRSLNPFWQFRQDLSYARSLPAIEKIYRFLRQQAIYENHKDALDAVYHSRLATLWDKEE